MLLASSSREDVLFTAVKAADGKVTMHIVNDGPARKANIAGPKMTWRAYVTDATRDMQDLGRVSEIELPAWSMITIVGD